MRRPPWPELPESPPDGDCLHRHTERGPPRGNNPPEIAPMRRRSRLPGPSRTPCGASGNAPGGKQPPVHPDVAAPRWPNSCWGPPGAGVAPTVGSAVPAPRWATLADSGAGWPFHHPSGDRGLKTHPSLAPAGALSQGGRRRTGPREPRPSAPQRPPRRRGSCGDAAGQHHLRGSQSDPPRRAAA